MSLLTKSAKKVAQESSKGVDQEGINKGEGGPTPLMYRFDLFIQALISVIEHQVNTDMEQWIKSKT